MYELKCEKPYVAIRYECIERDSLTYYIQEYSMKAEMFLAKREFWENRYNITEIELFFVTYAENIVFDKFIEMVKNKQVRLLT